MLRAVSRKQRKFEERFCMKAIDTGNDKVRKLCEVLQRDTLDPAKGEAAKIVEHAHEEAKRIVEEAKGHAKEIIEEARQRIEQEKQVFETAVALSARQAISSLQQDVEKVILEKGFNALVEKEIASPMATGRLLEALVDAVKEAGLDGSILAVLPAHLKKEEVLSAMSEKAVQAIQDMHSEPSLKAGVRLKIQDKNLVLDFSGQVIKELLSTYVREDFRKRIFNA